MLNYFGVGQEALQRGAIDGRAAGDQLGIFTSTLGIAKKIQRLALLRGKRAERRTGRKDELIYWFFVILEIPCNEQNERTYDSQGQAERRRYYHHHQ